MKTKNFGSFFFLNKASPGSPVGCPVWLCVGSLIDIHPINWVEGEEDTSGRVGSGP